MSRQHPVGPGNSLGGMHGLARQFADLGIAEPREVVHNPSYDEIFELETNPSLKGLSSVRETELGAVAVRTGKHMGAIAC